MTESSSSSKSKVGVIKEAIKQVMEEGGDDDDRLLSKLMSQLEKLEEEEEEEEEKIVKEVKKVRRQNVITHCLLSAMILLTVAWQISEVSIILKLKHGVTHPFRSVGSLLKSIIMPTCPPPLQDAAASADDDDAETSITSNLIESTPVHNLKIHLPKIDLPFNNQQ